MWNLYRRRRVVAVIATAVAVVLILLGTYLYSVLVAPIIPGPLVGQITALQCSHDPAAVAAPPNGPDGRPNNYLHTCGASIFNRQGVEVRITGLNWSGMENSGNSPGGLGNRNYNDILDQVASLGYNTVRIPFSNDTLDSGQAVGNVDFALNPDLQGLTGLQVLDRLVDAARKRGLKVILDRHQPTADGRIELWYTPYVSEDRWLADWRMLAARYKGNDTVIGADLSNEPHGAATWGTNDLPTDWRLAAERGGNAILDVNPYWLIFVEGVENVGGDHFWWGGNLLGVQENPVRLHVPNRVVYSPHDYGPAISGQPWFSDPKFPTNLAGEWDRHWGYIARENIAPVVIGEFGGWSFGNDPNGEWQEALLRYITANHLSALVWSLNPSWDTGGILNDDWTTVNQAKDQAYRPILAPPIDAGPTGVFGRAPTTAEVLSHLNQGGSAGDQSVTLTVINDSPNPLDLTRVELRYWYGAGGSGVVPMQLDANADGMSNDAFTSGTAVDRGRPFAWVRFEPGAATIAPYRRGLTVTLRLRQSVQTLGTTKLDSAGSASGDIAPVTAYVDGRLSWGTEPGG